MNYKVDMRVCFVLLVQSAKTARYVYVQLPSVKIPKTERNAIFSSLIYVTKIEQESGKPLDSHSRCHQIRKHHCQQAK